MSEQLIEVQVVNKVVEAEGIVSLELETLDKSKLPPYKPGAHIDVVLPNGLIRQYSLYKNDSAPSRSPSRYSIAVLREQSGRGGSQYIHDELEIGSVLSVSQPRNLFELVDAKKSILLAGGIGVTPIMCMASQLARDGADFTMHYCCRSSDRMAFKAELSTPDYGNKVLFHIDEEAAQPAFNAAEVFAQPDKDTHLYVCGPKGFMDFIISTAKKQGWADENIHFEYFSGVEMTPDNAEGFQIKLANCGTILPVKDDETVLHVLREHGVEVPVSCEQGVCGTCVTRVLDGEPDHRDLFLTSAERDSNSVFTPCCSRSKSALLVLDL